MAGPTFAMWIGAGALGASCPEWIAEARAHMARKQWSEAATVLETCLAREPGHGEGVYWQAHVLFQMGRYAEALERILPWIGKNPENGQARKVQGLSLFMLGRQVDARVALEKAAALAPEDAETRYYHGRVLFTGQDMPGALAEFERVVALEAGSVRGYNHLGQTLEALARFEEAAGAYRKAMEFEATQAVRSEWPYYNLGLLELKNGRAARAIPLLAAAIERQPKMWEARVQLAVAQAWEGRLEAARVELAHVLANAPDHASAHYQMGRLLTRMGKREEAGRHLARFEQLRGTPARRD